MSDLTTRDDAMIEELADRLARAEKLISYLNGAVKRAEARQSESEWAQGLDRGYASGFRLAAKWLDEALHGDR